MKKISVIVPVYNAEKWLKRCVDSILNQNYDNFELILVNDGSKDNSGAICDEYANYDARVKVIHKENGGVSDARNAGIDKADGDYITFVDSDDELKNGFFENAFSKIENEDWYISGISELLKQGDKIIERNSKINESRYMTVVDLYNNCERDFPIILLKGPCHKFYKRSIVTENNLLFDKTLSLGEDLFFNIQYVKFAKTVFFDEAIYYLYHKENENSLTTKFYPNKYEEALKIYDNWRSALEQIGVSNEAKCWFENLYFGTMVRSIAHFYQHNRTKKEKKMVVDKVVKNKWIEKNRTYGNNFSSKLIRTLITRKLKVLVRIAFWIKIRG